MGFIYLGTPCYFFCIHTQNRLGHIFPLATQICLCLDLRIPCFVSGWFSALQFVPPAPEVQAEIK